MGRTEEVTGSKGRGAGKGRKGSAPTIPEASPRAEYDKCRERGCKPLTATLPKPELEEFLAEFDARHHRIRRGKDCWDVELVRRWAVAAREAYGMRTALMGLIVVAHFKSLRTWGVINSAFKEVIDWEEVRELLACCGRLWGKKKRYAVYSRGAGRGRKGSAPRAI